MYTFLKTNFFNSVHPNWRQETFVRSFVRSSAHIDAFLTRYVCLFVRSFVRSIDRSIDDTARTCFPRLSVCASRDTRRSSRVMHVKTFVDCVHFASIENQKSIFSFHFFHPCDDDDDDDGNAPCVRTRSFVSRDDVDVGRHLRRPSERRSSV